MTRLGRKIALVVAVEELEDGLFSSFLVANKSQPAFYRIPFLLLVADEASEVLGAKLAVLENPWAILQKDYEYYQLTSQCRKLLTDFFAKSETAELVRFANILDVERLSEDFIEMERERDTIRVQLQDFRSGLFQSPWKQEPAIISEIVERTGRILGIEKIRRTFKQGDVLLIEGSENRHLFFIVSGRVELCKDYDGDIVRLGELGAGAFAGVLSFVEGRPSFTTATALEKTTVLKISTVDLKRMFSHDTVVSSLMFSRISLGMASRIRQQSQLQLTVSKLNAKLSRERDELQGTLDRLERTRMKLVEAEKMAVLGEFVAGIAHELNNPAGALQRGAAQLEDTLFDLLAGFSFLSAAELEVIRPLGVNILQKAINETPLPLPEIRRRRKTFLQNLKGKKAQEFAKKFAEIHLDRNEVLQLIERISGSRNFAAIVNALHNYHYVGQGLRHIMISSERVEKIVRSLRSYARQDTDEFECFDVRKGIEDTLTMLGHLMKGKSVIMEFAEVPKVSGKPAELNQVWTNLLANAAEAIGDAGSIKVIVKPSDAETVAVIIEDNGPGIPPEIFGKIWDINFTTKKGAASFGLGLGLAITKDIIERHNGEIFAKSEPGCTRFTVRLPACGKLWELEE